MSKFIKINLNQTLSRFQLEELRLSKQQNLIIIGIVTILTGLFIWQNVLNYQLSDLISIRISKIEEINADIKSTMKAGEINLAKNDIESLFNLEKTRIFWTPKIKVLAEITPANMAITEIEYIRTRFIISAITEMEDESKEFDTVEKLIKDLSSNPIFYDDFESIKFISSSREMSKGHEIYSFKIEAKLKSDFKRKKKSRKTRS